jgi:aspartate racemase
MSPSTGESKDRQRWPARKTNNTMGQPVIGILAGMGPRSTAPFIDLVVTECQRQYGAKNDADFPRMMICSQPTPFYEDRPTDHMALEAAIRDGLKHLDRAGVDFIAIACNTAHIYYPQLARCVSVPVLNMIDLAIDAIPSSTRSLALLASRPTVEAGIYQAGLHRREVSLKEMGWQLQVDNLLGAVRTSTDPSLFAGLWRELIEQARTAGVHTLLVACLDLSAVISHVPTEIQMVDASRCLAEEVVRQWLSRRTA